MKIEKLIAYFLMFLPNMLLKAPRTFRSRQLSNNHITWVKTTDRNKQASLTFFQVFI